MFSINFKPIAAAVALILAGATAPDRAAAQDTPFIGQVSLFGFNFCPRGWLSASGQLLPISGNEALFSLIGTIYGGDGRTNFALPDLRGRAAINQGTVLGLSTYAIGERDGSESFRMTSANQLPSHNHMINVTNEDGNKGGPGTDFLAVGRDANGDAIEIYHEGPSNRQMDPGAISNTGSSQPVEHRGPYLTMNWCIATVGIFPPRS